CHRGRAQPREVLAEMLWPDEDVEATRDRLRQALAAIRRGIESDGIRKGSVLVADRAEVALSAAEVITDVEQFEQKLLSAGKEVDPAKRLDLLREAIEIYGGELMPGYYDSWVISERDRLAELYCDCLCQAAALSHDFGETRQA